jgi:very-short-patch-repair endonuclease
MRRIRRARGEGLEGWGESPRDGRKSMRKPTSTILDRHARRMRRAMTEPEKRLWWHLRHPLPLERTHFRRQVVIGTAIGDFACVANKLVVEVDGAQHGDDHARAYDVVRASTLEREGWRVQRF